MTAPRKAAAARARRPTPAELGAGPAAESTREPRTVAEDGFDPAIDFDLASWRDEQRAQETEAATEVVKFRLDDRRPDAPDRTYLVEIPVFSSWPFRATRLGSAGTLDSMFEALSMVIDDPDALDVIDALKASEVGAVIEHLVKASGVTPGESKPSGASSRSTRRR